MARTQNQNPRSGLIPVTFYLDPRHAAQLAGMTQQTPVQTRRRRLATAATEPVNQAISEIRDRILSEKLVKKNPAGIKLASRLANSLGKLGIYNLSSVKGLDPDELADTDGFGAGQAKLLRQLQKSMDEPTLSA